MWKAACDGRLLLRLNNPEEVKANTIGTADRDERVSGYDYQQRLDSSPVYRQKTILAETKTT